MSAEEFYQVGRSRTCDACGAAAMRDVSLDCKGVHPLCGPCAAWDGEAKDQLALRALVARRAAQSPKVGAEVDPRTLPVGAEYHHRGFKYVWVVVAPGFARYKDKLGKMTPVGLENVVLISLPEAAQEVELGSLALGEWFDWAPSETDAVKYAAVAGVTGPYQVQYHSGDSTAHTWKDRNTIVNHFGSRKVLRVPPPTSAVEPEPVKLKSLLSEFANIDPNCFACGNACESRCAVPVGGQHYGICKGCQTLHEAGHREAIAKRIRARLTPQPADSKPRWPNTPVEHHPRLDKQLAQQVASGGQDCKAAWSLIERADRLRREAAAEEAVNRENRNTRSIVYGQHNRWLGEQGQEGRTGIASLRLERPLIAYKRRK